VTFAVVDDHLLRDVLGGEVDDHLREIIESHELATTNMYYVRLCRSVVAAQGGKLTGGWSPERRRDLGQRLVQLPETIRVLALREIGYRTAELAADRRLSTLGAEAVAAAEHLGADLCVWEGDDGPGIRSAAAASGITYRTVPL
jgi:hypothetical protein